MNLCAKSLRGMQWPMRIAKKLAREEHEVGLSSADDRVGLLRAGDQSHCAGGDASFSAEAAR